MAKKTEDGVRKVYMIKSRTTGLYSKGGGDVSWSKNGKVWNGVGPLKLHLGQLTKWGKDNYERNDAYIIEVVYIETELRDMSIDGMMTEMRRAHDERNRADKARADEQDRKKRHDEYLKLKKEFGE